MNANLLFATIVSALGSLLFGFDTAVISGTTKSIMHVFQLSNVALGWTASDFVVLPTSWKANDTVPLTVSYPQIVNGIRSPSLPFMTIRNCPACDLAAISGASTSNNCIFGTSSFLVTILYVL